MSRYLLLLSVVFFFETNLFAEEPPGNAELRQAVQAAVTRKDTPGAVLIAKSNKGRFFFGYEGHFSTEKDSPPVERTTIYDLASLTKPIATATSIFILIDQGKLKLTDTVNQHWPEFKGSDKEKITIEQLLLHTSGLIADNALADYQKGKATAFEKIANLTLQAEPGTKTTYSDVGYIVLGHLVERISKKSLDEFATENIFKPLKMNDTGFNIGKDLEKKKRTAPTAKKGDTLLQGTVHDPRASELGGVAGHAGLFSTADDLLHFATMLLQGGKSDGKEVLSAKSVELFTAPVKVPGGGLRSRGWDVNTAFSSPRGTFPAPDGYGHTGFTGTSIWIDPPTQTIIVILTNRVNISEKASVTQLRKEAATIVHKEWHTGKK